MQCHSPDMTFFLRLHVVPAVEGRFAVHAGQCTRGGWWGAMVVVTRSFNVALAFVFLVPTAL